MTEPTTLRLVGPDAIAYAVKHARLLSTHAATNAPARENVGVDEATGIAKRTPELVYLDADAALAIVHLAELCARDNIDQGHSGYWTGDLFQSDLEALEALVGADRAPTDEEHAAFRAAFIAYFDEHAPEDPRG